MSTDVRYVYKCKECGERLVKVQTTTHYGNGWREETDFISPCQRCIERHLADRGAFVIVRPLASLNSESGTPDNNLLVCSTVFLTEYEANAQLTEFQNAGVNDLHRVPFSQERHRVFKLNRRM